MKEVLLIKLEYGGDKVTNVNGREIRLGGDIVLKIDDRDVRKNRGYTHISRKI